MHRHKRRRHSWAEGTKPLLPRGKKIVDFLFSPQCVFGGWDREEKGIFGAAEAFPGSTSSPSWLERVLRVTCGKLKVSGLFLCSVHLKKFHQQKIVYVENQGQLSGIVPFEKTACLFLLLLLHYPFEKMLTVLVAKRKEIEKNEKNGKWSLLWQ